MAHERARAGESTGLLGIRERDDHLLEGRINIKSQSEKGTHTLAFFPVSRLRKREAKG